MLVNCIKTKCMLFGKQPQPILHFNDNTLDIVYSYKFLGNMVNSIISSSGNMFRTNASYLVNQAQKSTFKIQKNCRNIGSIPSQCRLHLYESLVQPILTYGSEIWGWTKSLVKSLITFSTGSFVWYLKLNLQLVI